MRFVLMIAMTPFFIVGFLLAIPCYGLMGGFAAYKTMIMGWKTQKGDRREQST